MSQNLEIIYLSETHMDQRLGDKLHRIQGIFLVKFLGEFSNLHM